MIFLYKVGDRVKLSHAVDRYPHFIAPEGATGTIVEISPAESHPFTRVRMDDYILGAEDWDNEIHWFDGLDPASDFTVIS